MLKLGLKFHSQQQTLGMKNKKKFLFGKNKTLIGQIMKHLKDLMKVIRQVHRLEANQFQKLILHPLFLKIS